MLRKELMQMIREELKNKIILELVGILEEEGLNAVKRCLDRNFHNVVITRSISTKDDTIHNDTNEEMIKKFIFHKKLEGLSAKTIDQYTTHTRKLFSVTDKHYSDVTSNDISYYLSTLMMRGNSNTTINNNRKFIKPFFKWLYENEYIKKDIFMKIKAIKYKDKQKEYLTEHEIVNLRDAASDDVRALALIDFLISTGVRVSECSNVKISDVDFATGSVKIYATKTNQYRKVYLDSNANKHLRDYLASRNDSCEYLFANARRNAKGEITNMSANTIQQIIKGYCSKADIQKESCTVHLFRKTLATRLKQRGVDLPIISKILGHNATSTTEKYYLSLLDEDIRYAYMRSA